MNKLAIVPFTRKEYPLISLLAEQAEICALISPQGFGIEGQDISVIRNGEPSEYVFSNSLEQGILMADKVIISQVNYENKAMYEYAKRALLFASKTGKTIECFLPLKLQEKEKIQNICLSSNAVCHFFEPPSVMWEAKAPHLGQLFQFNVPVIYIGEMAPDCDGYDIFLKLANRLRLDGKSVLAVSNDVYNNLFGYTCFNWDCNAGLANEVMLVNSMIHSLVIRNCPEIVLIKLPLPMMKLNAENSYDGGLTAYAITQAIPGDGCIYCSLFDDPSNEMLLSLNLGIQYKFGFPIEALHISNRMIDKAGGYRVNPICIPISSVDEIISVASGRNPLSTYNLQNEKDFMTFYDQFRKKYIDFRIGVI